MAASENTTRDAFNNYGNRLEQLRASITVFRHAFPALNRTEAEAHLFGLEEAAASLEDSFISIEKANSPAATDDVSYDMSTDDFVRWIASIGFAIERLNDDSSGSPDFEVRHLAQVQRFLASEVAKGRTV